jgi:hypothetical protein
MDHGPIEIDKPLGLPLSVDELLVADLVVIGVRRHRREPAG